MDGLLQSVLHNAAALAYGARRRAATLALIAISVPLGYKAFCGNHGALAYHEEQIESQKLNSEISELQQKNDKLQANIKALKTDPKAIEREAREQLHYARPDDVVITLPQTASTSTTQRIESARKR
ncbi:MAG TPA: septum formation initiator family protein [Terriglobales bacterium]